MADDVVITDMRVADDGELTANVTIGEDTIPVTRASGSWTTYPDERGAWREIIPPYTALLQEKAIPFDPQARKVRR